MQISNNLSAVLYLYLAKSYSREVSTAYKQPVQYRGALQHVAHQGAEMIQENVVHFCLWYIKDLK